MNKVKVKRFSKWMAAGLITTVMIAGCSGNNGGSGESNSGGGETNGNGQAAAGTEVGYPQSFSYWVELDGDSMVTMSNFNEVGAYKEFEKITGTKVEFKHPGGDSNQVKEQFNLLIASNNLPDVIQTGWLKVPRGPQNAIKEGTLLRLNDLIKEHAPNFQKFLDEHPDVANMIVTDDGDIYGFPFIRMDDRQKVFFGPMMRADWLQKVGLEAPTTIEEWEKVLTAFRDGDPNENGQKDEIPFLLEVGQVRDGNANSLIGAWDILLQFFQVDGKVKYGEIEPEFENFVATMNDWYKKGLIDPDFAAVDGKLKDANVTGHKLGAFYGYSSGSLGKYMDLVKDHPTFELKPTLNPSREKGKLSAAGQISPTYPGDHVAAITTAAKHPEEIVKWFDLGYSEQGSMLYNFGVEGESYEMVDGAPKYKEIITKNPEGLAFKQAQARYMRSHFGGPFIQDVSGFLQQMKFPQQLEAIEIWGKAENKIQMPPITLTAEESSKLGSIMNDINTYSEEMLVKFIMGVEPLENLKNYADTLRSFGIEEAISIQQAALDRYNNR
ncbi:ABC transporter substrate-binding protein [Paenibacillus sp. YIM B09110]|uniref:ABC transporter substrate-binding protein n=1 Tax=Paenibacillus sp. YIM B09110 TaxID=3126102 RepID=UPI00301D001D